MRSSKLLFAFALAAAPLASAEAQPLQQYGVDAWGAPLCHGPLGPGRCADILAWLQRGGMNQGGMNQGGMNQGGPVFGPPGPMGIPTNIVTHDGQLVAQIAQACS